MNQKEFNLKKMIDLELKIKKFLDEINNDTLKILKIGNMLPIVIKNFLIYTITNDINLEKNILEREIKNFYLKNNLNDKEILENLLKKKGIQQEELHYQITLPLKICKFAEEKFKNELKDYFLNKKEFLDEYTFNIIRVKKSDLAYELYFQLDSEESDFIELSQKYSFYSPLYPEGIFGPRNLQGINPIIRKKLLNSLKGNLIMPFKVDDWWLIIKLIEKKSASLNKQTTEMLFAEIFDKFVNKFTQDFIKEHFKTY